VKAAVLVLVLSGLLASGNAWNLHGQTVPAKPVPTVTFTWSLSTANPPFYSFVITPMGSASYKSFFNSDQRTGAPYTIEFSASRRISDRVFDLMQQLNFLRGRYPVTDNLSSTIASNSLTYALGVTQQRLVYTSSRNQNIRELTSLFQTLAVIMRDRRLLENSLARNPRGLQAQLQDVKLQRTRGKLMGLQIIRPVLAQIASDANLSQPVRQLAQSMLH
jgi:hypothetical protein